MTQPTPKPPAARDRVLVVEDNWALREGLCGFLRNRGFEVDAARSVAQGLDCLPRRPQFMLLDLNLSDGLGTELLKHVRRHNLPIKVALLSASHSNVLLAEIESLQPDVVIPKPFALATLLNWLRGAPLAAATPAAGAQ